MQITPIIIIIIIILILILIPSREGFYKCNNILYPCVQSYYKDSYKLGLYNKKFVKKYNFRYSDYIPFIKYILL